jgi:molybdopterin synthase catalytic subunit
MSLRVSVTRADIDVAAELARLEALGGGGVASFTGIVRGDGDLVALQLDAYEAMAQAALHDITEEAGRRWPLAGITLIHRHGTLPVGARIVLVAVASRHRAAALDACAFLIDWTKTRAPFWKRELFADGSGRWIEARPEDDAVAAGWSDSRPLPS